ncbi:MBL fold metallo-hydrolase [Thermanaerosceptrum fracticalcis]|uniref:MBL fold metallo-hydrolase n=1 Tax=Thermanaerosceptrum fracticalcis TaxID=1712410 RepID=A0A7G6E537_THEFR|nr:N-acyl homoserine lactonase family protein [Thermanaerosceptrum fracticalcis]QNB47191.1 MBL fold metallo-hydrolase [Thermanaerosceptrum fracticalcis]
MWGIKPLNLGTLTVYKSGLTFGKGAGERLEVPCIGWLLTNSNGNCVLVDTGPSDDENWGTKYHNPLKKSKNQRLEFALEEIGVKPEDIKLCLLTHLHWDHAYGALKLPNAKIVVQSEELKYSVDPLPPDRKHYEMNIEGKKPFFINYFERIETVNGDCHIDEGLEVVLLPGHSPGSQGILVTTPQKKYLITGDLINIRENWDNQTPPGIFYSLEHCYNSFAKMKKINADILPGHDWEVFRMF